MKKALLLSVLPALAAIACEPEASLESTAGPPVNREARIKDQPPGTPAPTITFTATGTRTGTATQTSVNTVTNTITTTNSGARTYTATRTNSGTVTSLWTFTGSGTQTMVLQPQNSGTAVVTTVSWSAGTYPVTGRRGNATMTGTDSGGNTATFVGVESGSTTASWGQPLNNFACTWTGTSTGSVARTVTGTGTWTSTQNRSIGGAWTGSATFTPTSTASSTATSTATATVVGTSTATVTSTVTSTQTATNPCVGTWAYCDNFEAGNANSWTVKKGAASDFGVVADGSKVYRQGNSTSSTWSISRVNRSWQENQTLEAKVKPVSFASPAASIGLFLRYTATQEGDCAHFLALNGDGSLSMNSWQNGEPSAIGSSVATGIAAGTWYTVKLVQRGGVLQAYLDGNLVLSRSASWCEVGSVGVGSVGAVFEVDDVRVTADATNKCIENWVGHPCDICTGQTQSDLMHCDLFLNCYAENGCSPEGCGGQDDICGVNQPGLNSYGTAPKNIADQVYKCMNCPGSVSCRLPAKPDGTICADGDGCTQQDTCQQGRCVGSGQTTCPTPADGCHYQGTCISPKGVCNYVAKDDGASCDDGNPCTRSDTCQGGFCTGKDPLPCNGGDQCHGVCNSTSGSCEDGAKQNGTVCSDGDSMTRQDSCQGGTCTAGGSISNRIIPPDVGDTVQPVLPAAFSVTHDGAATYSIPIEVPEGRAGMTPSLALTYSSSGGDGLLGVGWNISGATSHIARCNRTHAMDGEALPITFGAQCDSNGRNCKAYAGRFCLDGEYLVPAETRTIPNSDKVEYRLERNPAVRVTLIPYDTSGPVSFLVEYPDGRKATYDHVQYAWIKQAVANHKNWDPTTEITFPNFVSYRWFLSKVSDMAGNTIEFTYEGGGAYSYYKVPKTISYTSLVENGQTTVQPLRKVVFDYVDRPDPRSMWEEGIRSDLSRLLKKITVSGPSPVAPGTLWTYELGYSNDSVSGRSLLTSVKQCDGSGSTCKPPATFDWEKGASTFTRATTFGQNLWKGGTIRMGDFNGDGLSEMIAVGGNPPGLVLLTPVLLGRREISYRTGPVSGISYSALPQPDPARNLYPVDLDGDGRAELAVLYRENLRHRVRYYRFSSSTEDFVELPDDGKEVSDFGDSRLFFADLDGDHLPELIRPMQRTERGNQYWEYRKNVNGLLSAYALLGPADSTGGTLPVPAYLSYNTFVADFDGSGRDSFLFQNSVGGEDTRYRSATLVKSSPNGIHVESTTVPWVARSHYNDEGLGKMVLDLNADGLADGIDYPARHDIRSTTSRYFTNIGRGTMGWYPNFKEPVPCHRRIFSDVGGNDVFFAMDVNQDGFPDVVSKPYPDNCDDPAADEDSAAGNGLRAFLSDGRGLTEPTSLFHSKEDGGGEISWGLARTGNRFRSLDANGDGLGDFIMPDLYDNWIDLYLHDGNKADMITDFHTGNGAKTHVTYESWVQDEDRSVEGCDYPVICTERGRWVVKEHYVEPGNGGQALPSQTYSYWGAAYDVLGRGWLGFQGKVVTDNETGRNTYTHYENTTRRGTSYPFVGLPEYTREYVSTGDGKSITSTVSSTYEIVSGDAEPSGDAYIVGLKTRQTVVTESDENGRNPVTLRSFIESFTYDSMGNIKKSERYTPSRDSESTVETTYLEDYTNWFLTAPTTKKVTSKEGAESSTRNQEYDYRTSWPKLLSGMTIEPAGDATQHLEVGITSRNRFGLPETVVVKDRVGNQRTSRIEYDDMEGSRPSVVTNSAGHASRTVYHMGWNLPVWQQDANGLVTNLYYYPFGRVKSVYLPGGEIVNQSYRAPASASDGVLELKTTLASGSTSATMTDSLGRVTREESLAMNGKTTVVKATYDSEHPYKVATTTVPKYSDDQNPDKTTKFDYDHTGRIKKVTTPDGRIIQNQYAGLTTTTTDAKGNVSYAETDKLGRLVKRVQKMPASDPDGAREIPISYTYGPWNLLRKITDASQNVVEAKYDSLGRMWQSVDPDRGTKTVVRNAFGDVLSVVDANGMTTFVPDVLGRITRMVSPDGTTTYTWDTAANGKGMLASSSSPDGVTTTMAYDQLSRLSTETMTLEGRNYALDVRYDGYGRPQKLLYPEVPGWSRFQVQHAYAANGDLLSLSDVPAGGGSGTAFWKANQRDEVGRIKQEEFGNSTKTDYTIDPLRSVLTGITTSKGTSNLQAITYEYDANLNLGYRYDDVSGLAEEFEYDALNRLRKWRGLLAYGWTVTYSHDDIGNLTGRALVGSGGESETLTFAHSKVNAGPHALTSSAWGDYTYDGKGNQITSPEGAVSYTSFDLPKRIVGISITDFKYDAAGVRVKKQSTSSTGSTVYVGGLYERRTTNGVETHVFYLNVGGRQVGEVVREDSDHSEVVLYIHKDSLGSTDVITKRNGEVYGERRKYDPFGAPTDMRLPKAFPGGAFTSNLVRRGFTGHEEDDETGLINMRGRIFNPRVGHFLTPDPLANQLSHPAGLNPYAYVLNNPLNYTDPSGFEECTNEPGACSFDDDYVYGNPGGGASQPGAGWDTAGPPISMGMSDFVLPIAKPQTFNGFPRFEEPLGDTRGTTIVRLDGGGWMRSDNEQSVYFETKDGRRGAMSWNTYASNYFYDYRLLFQSDPNSKAIVQRIRDNRGELNDNPIIGVSTNIAPMAVGGQSVPSAPHGGTAAGAPGGGQFILAMIPGTQAQAKEATDPKRPGESWLRYIARILTSIPGAEMLPMTAAAKGPAILAKAAKADLSKAVVNPKIYVGLEKQLAKEGADSIWKALDSALETLGQHLDKLPRMEYKSAVEKTIQNVSNQVETLIQFIMDKGL